MCGLIGAANIDEGALTLIAHRGPDSAGLARCGDFRLGHTRLAIQDLSAAGAQPFKVGPITLTFNGEIWNKRELEADGEYYRTDTDTERLAAFISRGGDLAEIEGMFAVAWHDERDGKLRIARDRFGEVPLHLGWLDGKIAWCSEAAPMIAFGVDTRSITWAQPGVTLTVDADGRSVTASRFADLPALHPCHDELAIAAKTLRAALEQGVVDRLVGDAPIAFLASGGLDSSGILALAQQHHVGPVVAYTAVFDPKSRDLRCARAAASDSYELIEVVIPQPSADDLARVVAVIEQPHKAQVEIGWACWHLAQRISDDGHRVVLSGEGSDELWASYGMAYHGIKKQGWHRYRWELFAGQHRKNFARTNKVFMRYGVEARLPFLNTSLVNYALRLPQHIVTDNGRHPKAILADALDDLLPADIKTRPKVAFQTGAQLDKAAAQVVADPRAFYAAEYRRHFSTMKA